MPEVTLEEFVAALREEKQLDFHGYKPSTLGRRIQRRMAQLGMSSFADYLELLRADDTEVPNLLNFVLINVTEFFRDPAAWGVLRDEVLAPLFRSMRPGDTFRAWSAGCSSGEETYTLAILISELLGAGAGQFTIKIYGTDRDEEALTLARLGQYSAHQLRRVPVELRSKYFTPLHSQLFRIGREVRRYCIFGNSDLLTSAPISHCNLVLCRNVMIYFNAGAQQRILSKLQYCLEPGGVLFLGKSEPRLTENTFFRPISARWRIFQKAHGRPAKAKETKMTSQFEPVEPADSSPISRAEEELQDLQLHQKSLLQMLKSSVLLLNSEDVITGGNEVCMAMLGVPYARLAGHRIHATELAELYPEILARLANLQGTEEVQCRRTINGTQRSLAVILNPIFSPDGSRTGVVIHAEDITSQHRLQLAVKQLEATSEELQSANEELETTNEELQSTNEELETTNEELQSVNEELENMNEELEIRTSELHQATERNTEMLRRMPWPVIVVDRNGQVKLWNTAAQQMLGLSEDSVAGMPLDQLPILPQAMRVLLRRSRMAMIDQKTYVLRNTSVATEENPQRYDIHFTPLVQEGARLEGLTIMFGPVQPSPKAKSNVGEANQ